MLEAMERRSTKFAAGRPQERFCASESIRGCPTRKMRPTRSQGRFETETGKLPQRHCLRGSFLLDYARRGKGLVAGTRQRGRLGSSGLRGNIVGINRSSPASDALHPVAAEQTADVSLIGELVAIGERVQRLRVNGGVRELVEPSGGRYRRRA